MEPYLAMLFKCQYITEFHLNSLLKIIEKYNADLGITGNELEKIYHT